MENRTSSERAWRSFRRNRPAVAGMVYLGFMIGIILAWPLVSSVSPDSLSEALFQAPGDGHWMGTDAHGRDLMSRIFYGARISLLVGIVGALVSLFIGVTWGAVSGYVGGRCDGIMMRTVDLLYSLPSIVFVIVLVTTLEGWVKEWFVFREAGDIGPGIRLVFLFVGLGAVSWLTMARIVRGQVLALRGCAFVEASRLLGASHARILVRHILPNISGVVLVYLMLTIPAVILYESFLSYLGLGIEPPQASLGSLIAEGAGQINSLRIYWWLVVFPAGLLSSMLLALNFVGDGLREAFDPRMNHPH